MKEYGHFCLNNFVGSVVDKDALLDLHEGDLVAADVSFHACKKRGKWVQYVYFGNLTKLKEVI